MMVNRYRCDCGHTEVDALTVGGEMTCAECGESLEFVGKPGCVRGLSEGQTPNSTLRELVEKWREHNRAEHAMFNEAQFQAADELEERIDD